MQTNSTNSRLIAWNGPVCQICHTPYLDTHECSNEALQRQIDFLKSKMKGAEQPSFAELCPCNPNRGGSGVCNCVLGGVKITC